MNNAVLTEASVIEKGMRSLVDTLGVVDAERFISIMNRKKQSYEEWRKDYFDKMTEDEYRQELFDFAKSQ